MIRSLVWAVVASVVQLSDAAATAEPVTGTTAPPAVVTGTTAPPVVPPASNEVKGTFTVKTNNNKFMQDPAKKKLFENAVAQTIAQKAGVAQSLVSVIISLFSLRERRRLESGSLLIDFTIKEANEAAATAARNALKKDPVAEFEPSLNANVAAAMGDDAPTLTGVDSASIDMSVPVTTSTDGGGWPWWAWFLLVLGICCILSMCCGGSAAFLLGGNKGHTAMPPVVAVRSEVEPLITATPQRSFVYAQPTPVATTMAPVRVVPTVATASFVRPATATTSMVRPPTAMATTSSFNPNVPVTYATRTY